MSAARGRGLRAMGAMMLAGGVAIAAAEMRMRACVPAGDVVEDDLVGRNGFIKGREGVPPGSAAPKACRAACANGTDTHFLVTQDEVDQTACYCLSAFYADKIADFAEAGNAVDKSADACLANATLAALYYAEEPEGPPVVPLSPDLWVEEIVLNADAATRDFINSVVRDFTAAGGATDLPDMLSAWLFDPTPPEPAPAPWWQFPAVLPPSPPPSTASRRAPFPPFAPVF